MKTDGSVHVFNQIVIVSFQESSTVWWPICLTEFVKKMCVLFNFQRAQFNEQFWREKSPLTWSHLSRSVKKIFDWPQDQCKFNHKHHQISVPSYHLFCEQRNEKDTTWTPSVICHNALLTNSLRLSQSDWTAKLFPRPRHCNNLRLQYEGG